jgi:hypothetical protein
VEKEKDSGGEKKRVEMLMLESGEREMWNKSERIGEKRERWREKKKKKGERQIYESFQERDVD